MIVPYPPIFNLLALSEVVVMLKFLRSKLSCLLIIFSYLSANILFNFYFWQQLLLKELSYRIGVFGEWPAYAYVAEIVRQNILFGKNPFSTESVLYPFGWNFALEDMAPINGFYFLFLRFFLTVHKSFILIALFSITASNLSMYLFLRYIKISRRIAFIIGLVFGYTPFVVIRLGHPTYLALYLFPLFFLAVIALKEAQHKIKKLIYAVLLSLVCVLSILTNLYYTLMIVLLCFSFFLFFLIFDRQKVLAWSRQLFPWVFISFAVAGLFLFPWLIKVYESFSFSQRVYAASLVDSITYSADLVSIFLPGNANPIYGKFIEFITTFYITFLGPRFENFIYPGLFILGAYSYFIFYKKQITGPVLKTIWPIFIISIIFWLLTLGPFLHIFGKKLPIPLPYLILHSAPYLNMARSPGRFIVPFIFLATIMAAFVVNDVLKNKLKITIAKKLFFLNLLLIFLLDQSYIAVLPVPYFRVIPPKIYGYLQSHEQGVLLEVPFTVRDGLRFQGSYHSSWLPLAQLRHKQNIFSVFGGRIRDDIFDYYKNDPLLGYVSRLINDPSVKTQSITEDKKIAITRSVNFLGIENVLVNKEETYASAALRLFQTIGFDTIMTDQGRILLYKKSAAPELVSFKLENPNSSLYLAEGWGGVEPTGRWVIGKEARVFFRSNKMSPVQVRFLAYTLVPRQKAAVYINKKKLIEIKISKDPRFYTFNINAGLAQGINRLVFKFADTIQPAKVIPNSQDRRDLAVFFREINFEKLTSIKKLR